MRSRGATEISNGPARATTSGFAIDSHLPLAATGAYLFQIGACQLAIALAEALTLEHGDFGVDVGLEHVFEHSKQTYASQSVFPIPSKPQPDRQWRSYSSIAASQ